MVGANELLVDVAGGLAQAGELGAPRDTTRRPSAWNSMKRAVPNARTAISPTNGASDRSSRS